jgi:hypothetical protein
LSLTKSMTSFLFKDSYNKFSSSLIELSAWPYSFINSSNTNITECMHHLFSLRCFIRAFNTFYWLFFSSMIHQTTKRTHEHLNFAILIFF